MTKMVKTPFQLATDVIKYYAEHESKGPATDFIKEFDYVLTGISEKSSTPDFSETAEDVSENS